MMIEHTEVNMQYDQYEKALKEMFQTNKEAKRELKFMMNRPLTKRGKIERLKRILIRYSGRSQK